VKVIKWGMIGCGSVTEKKSGPAFSIVKDSHLLAVTSRSYQKAQDYAKKHQLALCYEHPDDLISSKEINAIYIATPPSSHSQYTVEALKAGKSVYVEKPMARLYSECLDMINASKRYGSPLFVAYYRRALEYFKFIRSLIEMEILGKPENFMIELKLPPRPEDTLTDKPWRVQKNISGGGYFYDLASHQIDLIYYLLGKIEHLTSQVRNVSGLYNAEDAVDLSLILTNGVKGTGRWRFACLREPKSDIFHIKFEKGSISFSTFSGEKIIINNNGKLTEHKFGFPKHIQQPMIQSIVDELLGTGKSFSNINDAAEVNKWMEKTLENYYLTSDIA